LNNSPEQKFPLGVLLPTGYKRGYAPSKSRKMYSEMAKHPQIGRIALIGGSTFIRTATRFIVTAAGKSKKMRWFAEEEKATEWLKE
jgi:hypothetical protein